MKYEYDDSVKGCLRYSDAGWWFGMTSFLVAILAYLLNDGAMFLAFIMLACTFLIGKRYFDMKLFILRRER